MHDDLGRCPIPRVRASDDTPQFEVATLKRTVPPGDSHQITLAVVWVDRFTLSNVTLSDCLKFAYGLVSDDQIAGPDWIKSKTVLFEIIAKVEPNTPRGQLQLMTQTLLADRLKLKVRHEQRELHLIFVSSLAAEWATPS